MCTAAADIEVSGCGWQVLFKVSRPLFTQQLHRVPVLELQTRVLELEILKRVLLPHSLDLWSEALVQTLENAVECLVQLIQQLALLSK